MKDINVLPKNIILKEDIVVRAIVNTVHMVITQRLIK
tara:strand:+ start:91 stop:201 length:111 start_codon:yes stop_codon:yes gene_type:complete